MKYCYTPPRFREGLSKGILVNMDMYGRSDTKPKKVRSIAERGICVIVRSNVKTSRYNMSDHFRELIRE